ncbi:MAG: polymer-forming cytoskeletal protein [Butyrivibrio sp.]|nr:polymer-forming cytoskeletal protein [Butyrivibrio sp.]
MFNNKKVVTYDSEAEKVVTLIGSGAVCDGPFSSKDSTRVDGTINGAVRIDGSLIIGQTGKITGNIKAQNVFLAGEVTGNIDAGAGKVEISDTGKIVGDITTRSIVIDENAVFQGNCTMTADKSSAISAKERAVTPKESN